MFAALIPLAGLAFTIWMAVDCLRNRRDPFWIWIILFTPMIGALVYFFVCYWDGSRLEYGLWERLTAGGRIREIQARIHNVDNAANHEELGDAYLRLGKYKEAEAAYRASIERAPEGIEAQARLGYALLAQSRTDEAWPLLSAAYRRQPDFDSDEIVRQCARCQAARGQFADARKLYDYYLTRHSYTDAQYEFGELLLKMNEREEGARVLRELIDDLAHSPRYVQRRDDRWTRAAKRLLRAAK